ncbi:hypothetical protein TIFTF001_028856 [Ficus carica]|uniref:Uncharacterized protein n=1 Tax=Ficus carica TaxID=3494 RepID=A0AA88DQT6_FICCA|nr:hypothetical protein TIFTF001_028856 [Ficus carica]
MSDVSVLRETIKDADLEKYRARGTTYLILKESSSKALDTRIFAASRLTCKRKIFEKAEDGATKCTVAATLLRRL